MDKWTTHFLYQAAAQATMSKDPSTKCGAVIYHPRTKNIISQGYNGFPRGLNDTYDRLRNRDLKYLSIIHADINAILNADHDLSGCTLVTWPLPPCATCVSYAIQVGITGVIAPEPTDYILERWRDNLRQAAEVLRECVVAQRLIPWEDIRIAFSTKERDMQSLWQEPKQFDFFSE